MSPETTTDQRQCCDGTGWTGVDGERCLIHYEPVDAIWLG